MSISTKPLPTPEDALDFCSMVFSSMKKTNALLPGYDLDYSDELRETLSSHEFFQWIASTRKFEKSCRYMQEKEIQGGFPQSVEIKVAHSMAYPFIKYYLYKDKPERLNVAASSDAKKAVKHIKALQSLITGGLGGGALSRLPLLSMLSQFKAELGGKTIETFSISGKGDLLGFHLVKDASRFLEMHFQVAPFPVVVNLVSLVYKVDEQKVRRYQKIISTRLKKSSVADN
jgi:hypothetical protein